jgi:hypothetical protein
MPTIEERLQRLEDVEAIQRLQIRYAELCDDGFDPDAIVGLFTPDGVWDCGDYGRFVGEEMRAYWADTARVTELSLHYMANHVVDVEPSGTEATGRCYMFGAVTRNGEAQWMAVRYDERYRKVDDEWRFSEMTLRPAFMTPFERSWAAPAPAGGGR